MDVKSRIDSTNKSRSLRDLLKEHVKDEFKDKLENIKFKSAHYEIKKSGVVDKTEMDRLKQHLESANTDQSAICFLENRGDSVGHVVSMYNYDANDDAFAYKDSMEQANTKIMFQNKQYHKKLLLRGEREHTRIAAAWTFEAHYYDS